MRLLASRYFASLTEPHNLIGLVPALITLFKQQGGDKPKANVMYERSLLLQCVLQLVHDDTHKALSKFFENRNHILMAQKMTIHMTMPMMEVLQL